MPACPRCHSEIQADWNWCHVCGFDPDGLKPPEPDWRDLPSPRFGENPEWAAPIGDPAGYAPGIGAPRWGPPPVGSGLYTNGNGHGHPPPPRRRSTATVILVVLAGAVAVLMLLLVVLVLAVTLLGRSSADVVGTSTTATVAPGAAGWVAPDGSVAAAFPVSPTQGPGAPATHSTAAGTLWEARRGDVTFFVMVSPLVPGARLDATAALNSGIDGFDARFKGTYYQREPTTVDGHKAETFDVTGTTGTVVRGTVAVSGHAIYVIAASGPETAVAELEAFRGSLHVPA